MLTQVKPLMNMTMNQTNSSLSIQNGDENLPWIPQSSAHSFLKRNTNLKHIVFAGHNSRLKFSKMRHRDKNWTKWGFFCSFLLITSIPSLFQWDIKQPERSKLQKFLKLPQQNNWKCWKRAITYRRPFKLNISTRNMRKSFLYNII